MIGPWDWKEDADPEAGSCRGVVEPLERGRTGTGERMVGLSGRREEEERGMAWAGR